MRLADGWLLGAGVSLFRVEGDRYFFGSKNSTLVLAFSRVLVGERLRGEGTGKFNARGQGVV